MGTAGSVSSWHNMYKDSAWIFIGGLNYELNEGDVITVFSQYGEIVNVNLVRDKITGKSKGFAFVCYEDQRSTVLAVDNLNGITLVGRIIRVDHVESYKVPKMDGDMDEEVKKLIEEGCAPMPVVVGSKGIVKREIKDEDNSSRKAKREDKEHESSRHSSTKRDYYSKEDTSESRKESRRRERSRSRSHEDRRRSDVNSGRRHHHSDSRSRRSPSRDKSRHSREHHRSHRDKGHESKGRSGDRSRAD